MRPNSCRPARIPVVVLLFVALAQSALGDDSFTTSPHTSTGISISHTDANWITTVDIASMALSSPGSDLYVTMTNYVVGSSSSSVTNTVVVNGTNLAPSTPPLHLTISGCEIQQGGSLVFAGSMPAGSALFVSSMATSGTITAPPIALASLNLRSSILDVNGLTCTITMSSASDESAPCVSLGDLTLVNSSASFQNLAATHNNDGASITAGTVLADNHSALIVTGSAVSFTSGVGYNSMRLLDILSLLIHRSSLVFTHNSILTPTYGSTTMLYIASQGSNSFLDSTDSSIVVEYNSMTHGWGNNDMMITFNMNGDTHLNVTGTELLVQHNRGGSIDLYFSAQYSDGRFQINMTHNRYMVINNTGYWAELLIPVAMDSVAVFANNTLGGMDGDWYLDFEIYADNDADATRNFTLAVTDNIVAVSGDGMGIRLSTQAAMYDSLVNISNNQFNLGENQQRLGIDLSIPELVSSNFSFTHNRFESDNAVPLSQYGQFTLQGLNGSLVDIGSNHFTNFGHFQVTLDSPGVITASSTLTISDNNFTGHLEYDYETQFTGLALQANGDRIVVHDRSLVQVSRNYFNYTSPTIVAFTVLNAISTCLKPILTHFSSLDVSDNTVLLDVTVIPQYNTAGISVESCGSGSIPYYEVPSHHHMRQQAAGQHGTARRHEAPTQRPRVKRTRRAQHTMSVDPTMDDYSMQLDPQTLSTRCDDPIDYATFATNPGAPINAGDMPSDLYQWSVVLLAVSSVTVDNNTVVLRGHSHYNSDYGNVPSSPSVAAVVLPPLPRVTEGSLLSAKLNHLTNNVTMYTSFAGQNVTYTVAGLSPAYAWIGDNGAVTMSYNTITVSSPFLSWGVHPATTSTAASIPVPLRRKMGAMSLAPTYAYLDLNMPPYSSSTVSTCIVVGCNSSYRIDRNVVTMSGLIGTGGICLQPDGMSASVGALLSASDNVFVPAWIAEVPNYLEEPTPNAPPPPSSSGGASSYYSSLSTASSGTGTSASASTTSSTTASSLGTSSVSSASSAASSTSYSTPMALNVRKRRAVKRNFGVASGSSFASSTSSSAAYSSGSGATLSTTWFTAGIILGGSEWRLNPPTTTEAARRCTTGRLTSAVTASTSLGLRTPRLPGRRWASS